MSDIGTWNDDTIGNLVARLVVQHNIRFDASAAIFDALEMVRDDLQQRITQLEAELATLRERVATMDEWEDVPLDAEDYAANKARWIICHNGDVVIQYTEMGVRAPLPDGWELRRRPA